MHYCRCILIELLSFGPLYTHPWTRHDPVFSTQNKTCSTRSQCALVQTRRRGAARERSSPCRAALTELSVTVLTYGRVVGLQDEMRIVFLMCFSFAVGCITLYRAVVCKHVHMTCPKTLCLTSSVSHSGSLFRHSKPQLSLSTHGAADEDRDGQEGAEVQEGDESEGQGNGATIDLHGNSVKSDCCQ